MVMKKNSFRELREGGTGNSITGEKKTVRQEQVEDRLKNRNRFYSLLNKINETIFRFDEPREIFERVCRIAVEEGDFTMAWVGLVDKTSQLIKPVAHWGVNQDYIESLKIPLAEGIDDGFKPTRDAVLEQRHVICNDIKNDPRVLPFREEALQRGYRSSAAFPIIPGDKSIGALNLYSGQSYFFDADEIKLLGIMADNLSFAVRYIEREEMRLQAEKSLRESEERYRQLVELSPDMLAIHQEGRFVYMNTAGAKLLGAGSPQELIGKPVMDILHPDYHAMCRERVRRLLEENEELPLAHKKYVRLDGTVVDVEVAAVSVFYREAKAVQVISRDITERVQAQEAIDYERRKLFHILDEIPALIYIRASQDYLLNFVNRYFREVVGSPEEGQPCYECIYGRDAPCELCSINEILSTRRRQEWERNYNGRDYRFYGYPFYDVDGSFQALVLGIDITEKKQLEKEIPRLERLNLVGQMAAGIAHEIRNPMTTIRGLIQLQMEKDKPSSSYYDLMLEELDRVNAIITEFLSLARNKPQNLCRENLNSIVSSLAPLVEADAIKENKYIEVIQENVPDFWVDEKELRQLVLNLARNGLEAMSPGGKLKLKTYTQNGEVVLAVQDEGEGINQEVLDKIDTPFFTTKENGTGLGLAICYRMVERNGGRIEIDTGPGGTTFYVRFSGTS